MRFHELVTVSHAVARTRARLEKTSRLADLLKRLAPAEVPAAVTFLSGGLLQGRIGIGWSVIGKARETAPAQEPTLDVLDVDAVFTLLADVGGAGATRARRELLTSLFSRATAAEQDFLVRLMSGELRQGALAGILVEAVAQAAGAPPDAVRHAAMMCGNLGEVASAALGEGVNSLSGYGIELFRPLEPMLASPCESVSEALQSFGEAAFELKVDGARVQAHKSGSEVRMFSRNLRDVTPALPEVAEALQLLPAREVILDGEVIAMQPNGMPYPFQETMKRFGRRLEVDLLRSALPLTPYFFDCLYSEGRSLIGSAQRERFAVLESVAGAFTIRHQVIGDEASAAAFFDSAIAAGHEGVMAKSLTAPYAAGSRGSAWLKIKQVRTLDLVVLAAEWGNGRRRGWLSNLHLGARDPIGNRLVMLGKTFKGMTDELLKWQTAALLEREVGRDGHIVYVRPELVVEIAFNDVQESPQYPGGLALRFARVKGYRSDKTAAQADTLRTLQEIYRATTGRDAPSPRDADA